MIITFDDREIEQMVPLQIIYLVYLGVAQLHYYEYFGWLYASFFQWASCMVHKAQVTSWVSSGD